MALDFSWIHFGVDFNINNTIATRSFTIEGNPLSEGNGYLLIQALDIELDTHEILINDQNLPSFDLPGQLAFNQLWMTWMDRVPQSFLRQGRNSITIRRTSADDFRIENVVVHWREQTSAL